MTNHQYRLYNSLLPHAAFDNQAFRGYKLFTMKYCACLTDT